MIRYCVPGIVCPKRRKAMSHTVSTLLLRNLDEVFGEIDPARRRAVIYEIFHQDAVVYDPNGGDVRGRQEIDGIAGENQATHPDFSYRPLCAPDEMAHAAR